MGKRGRKKRGEGGEGGGKWRREGEGRFLPRFK